jgi:hypothetical protein
MLIVVVAFYFVVGAAVAAGLYTYFFGKKGLGQENAKPAEIKGVNPQAVVMLIGGIALPAILVWVGGKYGSGNAWVSPNSTTAYASSNGEVYVRGYYKKNGTYVQPYWRSRPDGDPSNNWSITGNVNPHTGEVGYRNPPAPGVPVSGTGYGASSTSSASPITAPTAQQSILSQYTEQQQAILNQYRGLTAQQPVVPADEQIRVQAAARLQQLGYNVDWRQYSYLTLSDWELRIQAAGRLQRLGSSVDWRQYSYLELTSMELRIQQGGK